MSTEHNISQVEAQMAYMKSQHDLKLAEIKSKARLHIGT